MTSMTAEPSIGVAANGEIFDNAASPPSMMISSDLGVSTDAAAKFEIADEAVSLPVVAITSAAGFTDDELLK